MLVDALLLITLAILIGYFALELLRPRGGEDAEAPKRATASRSVEGHWRTAAAGLVVLVVLLLFELPLFITVATALLLTMAAHIFLASRRARQTIAFEVALATALDLMVASLRSGAAILDSIESAAVESVGPTGVMLRDLRDRLRLGEALVPVLDDVVEQYPLEGVRMFAFTLGAHLDSGGSAATSLAEVARAIRDRVDVVRRGNSQSAETQASVVGILGITYGLALMMWRQYPDRVDSFAGSDLGSAFIGLSIVLQAVGLAWIWSITRIEV